MGIILRESARRDSIVEKRKLLRSIGLGAEFPKISWIGIAFKLVLNCLMCRCLTMGAKKDTADPRAKIPLIMPATAPPVPRRQYRRNTLLRGCPISRSHCLFVRFCLSVQYMSSLLDSQKTIKNQKVFLGNVCA